MFRVLGLALVLAVLLPAQSFVRVSRTNPRYLELSTREAYIPIGLNIGWERFATEESEIFAKTERRFRALAANGGNFARVWLSHPFYDLDPDAEPDAIAEKMLRIDRLIELARTSGIRLKLCLEHFRTMEPLPPAFPGSVSMGRPDLAPRFGNMNAFFAEERGRAWELRKMDLLATRYAANPTVFGWELWNEINAVKGTGWEEWTRAMLPQLKRRFPRQLALQSLGSFDREAAGEVYRRFSTMPGNEIAQVHRYLDPGAPLAVCHADFDVLAADAVTTLRGFVNDRPVLLSEVGAVEAHHAGPSKLYETDREGVLLHDGLFAPFFAGAAGPGHFWHWQEYVEKHNLWFWFGRFADAVRGIDPRAEEFAPATLPHDRVRIYVLRGQQHTLLWVRNRGTDRVSGVTVPLTGKVADIYDPSTGRHISARVRNGTVKLPPFRLSVVLRMDLS